MCISLRMRVPLLCSPPGRDHHELAHHGVQVQQALGARGHPHVRQADLLQPLELDVLRRLERLGDPGEGRDDVHWTVTLLPDLVHGCEGIVPILGQGSLQRGLDLLRLRLVVHPAHGLLRDGAKGIVRRLRPVEDVTHVALRGKNERLHTRLVVGGTFLLEYPLQPLDQLVVGDPAEAQDRTPGLDWLNQLRRDVTGQRKACGLAENLHGPSHGLLGSAGHAVGLVQNDDFQLALGQSDLLLREAFDLLPDDVDATII
mmetsp:Transcript_94232/g.270199  ORF Transcript_94232/g.270199 Transcript_94232/m.270199 type:complete len:258 (-) Transcript_94232:295-1068(-)